jgi:NADH-quinone oxidoreductase subunit M
MFNAILLSLIIFLPIIGGSVVLCLPRRQLTAIRWTALGFASANLILSLALVLLYSQTIVSLYNVSTFKTFVPWIPALGINYSLDVDGISALLVILTTLLTTVCIAASFRVTQKTKNYMAFMLLFESGMLGVFLSTNLFLFYIFWEVMLIPAYFLVGSWGGEHRIYAVFKFVLYTATGSLLALIGIIALGFFYQQAAGGNCSYTLELSTLLSGNIDPDTGATVCKAALNQNLQLWLMLAFAAAFAVKIPFVPLHSWLPDVYSEAPAPVTALLAGAMSKTGAYGFLRLCIPLFPVAIQQLAPLFNILAISGILYCAVLALVQTDLKRLLGYSSISHLGVVMLGMLAFNMQGIQGAVLQMVNHGITTAALFLCAGFIEERTGTRNLRDFGGLATRIPILATITLIVALSALGLPGLNSFAGEFLALLGAFQGNALYGTLGTVVVVPAAWYMLRFFQGVMMGPHPVAGPVSAVLRKEALRDIHLYEFLALLPLLALIFYIGLQPLPLTFLLHQSVTDAMQNLGSVFKP